MEFDKDDKRIRVLAERRWFRGKGKDRIGGFVGYTHDQLATAPDVSDLASRTKLWNWMSGEDVWMESDAAIERSFPELITSSRLIDGNAE